jgi:signal transduction histidine kinase
VSRLLARVLSASALVACLGSIVAGGVVISATQGEVPAGEIVVVGDPSSPGMNEVVEELEARVRTGDDLRGSDGSGGTVAIVLFVVLLLVWVGIGTLIVWRQPGNWAGWLFIVTGAPFPILSLAQAVMVYGLKVDPGSVRFLPAWATLGEFALYPVALLPLLFLLYPDGHLPSPRWRWTVIGLLGGTALAFVGFLLRPGPFNNWREDGIVFENPFGIDTFDPAADIVITVGAVTALISGVSAAVAIVLRFRRSTGEARQQMRLLAFVGGTAAALIVAMFVGVFVVEALGIYSEEEGPIFPILFGLAAFTLVIGVPVAYLVAIFRYRLWDLDVVIRKAVVFVVVATGITVLALLVVVVPVAVFGTGLSGWEWGLLSFGIALGVLVGPIQRRARRLADRIVYRSRATPYEVLTAFSERVGETYSIEDVLPRMVQVLASATGATSARVLLRVGDGVREVARWPEGDERRGEEYTVPVVHLGEELGVLAVTMPANDPMDPSKERLMRDLASQAGLVLRNVRLIEDLRASRKRIVSAQDERARKLERDLHDGAQQQLVALTVKLRLLQQLAERDASNVPELADQLQNDARRALDDLRDLARGIYPPLLADKGLPEAIQSQARRSILPVTVETDPIGRYPRDVESAVYFCTLEALNNVAKYANATRAVVRLAQSNGQLTFTVVDDGRGFDPEATTPGTGLQGMVDRLEAIGGSLDLSSEPGAGTTVVGRVPVGGLTQPNGRGAGSR